VSVNIVGIPIFLLIFFFFFFFSFLGDRFEFAVVLHHLYIILSVVLFVSSAPLIHRDKPIAFNIKTINILTTHSPLFFFCFFLLVFFSFLFRLTVRYLLCSFVRLFVSFFFFCLEPPALWRRELNEEKKKSP